MDNERHREALEVLSRQKNNATEYIVSLILDNDLETIVRRAVIEAIGGDVQKIVPDTKVGSKKQNNLLDAIKSF